MENKAISNFKNKTWYRTLKVFYIIIFVIIIVIYDANAQFNEPLQQFFGSNISQLFPQQLLNRTVKSPLVNVTTGQYTSYHIIKKYPLTNTTVTIINFIIGNLTILLIFEAIRRGFYYIVFGSLRPQN